MRLEEEPSQYLGDAAVDLAFHGGRVDRAPDVLDGDVDEDATATRSVSTATSEEGDEARRPARGARARPRTGSYFAPNCSWPGQLGHRPMPRSGAPRRAPAGDDLDIVDTRFEQVGGDRPDLAAGVLGRELDGAADGVRDLAAAEIPAKGADLLSSLTTVT